MKKQAVILFLAVLFAPLFAQDACQQTAKLSGGSQLSMNGNQGMGNLSGTDYHYEAWIEGGNSSDQKLIWYGASQGGGAAFRAEWKNPNDYLGRIGYYWGGSNGPAYSTLNNVYMDFNYTRSGNNTAGDYSYIGVYGWARNPSASNNERLIEYYVVEDWYGNQWQDQSTPVGNNTIQGTNIGSFTVDGSGYDLYKKTRTGPSIDGNSTFTQIFSVRKNQRKCGTISVTEHFKEWEKTGGLKFNNLYDLKFLVEAGGGTGWFDATYIKITKNAASSGSGTSSSSVAASSSSRASSSSVTASSSSRASSSSAVASSSSIASSSSAAESSSSQQSEIEPSSSSEESTLILTTNHLPLTTNQPTYYNLKGEPLGTTKPVNPGIYIEKNGNQVHKIVVR
uniref:endo-1,4-beta-xylanase n=1 Tax=uncultured bacterium contig00052 TaxID=1181536 RepID=A0A806JYR6_9BACT|nr:endo-1,4-beta-xylanase A precursor [uncultured bacterium contig00052]